MVTLLECISREKRNKRAIPASNPIKETNQTNSNKTVSCASFYPPNAVSALSPFQCREYESGTLLKMQTP
ncbi:hypothetical protein CEXT_413081 [Caerostris extrusa]|uniref:Uncharacterized protein n=1 Tax=Caerostris extrusa TaxID=172846 RepID=A0AAV4SX73_CAEEX|nr:hypothetical protein CEXT_413081 [Caerostris extrusa]